VLVRGLVEKVRPLVQQPASLDNLLL